MARPAPPPSARSGSVIIPAPHVNCVAGIDQDEAAGSAVVGIAIETIGRAVDICTLPIWFSTSAWFTSAVTVRVLCLSR